MIEWNKVKYIDCMDEKEGMPSLPDKSIDLGFTDPPYNVKFTGEKKGLKPGMRERKYFDKRDNYLEWCQSWFNELKRICEGILIHCGFTNLNMWIKYIEEPRDIIYHYKEDVQSQSSLSHLTKITPILCYGSLRRFAINPIKIKNKYDKFRGNFHHPCPLNYGLVFKILQRQKPSSVIDPFMGSGTTAFCCKQLNIKYFGYEIDEVYKTDLKYRIGQSKIKEFT